MDLDTISLRATERGLLLGGSGSGKSTLMHALIKDFVNRYRRGRCRVLVLDTKPRWQASRHWTGRSVASLYKGWDHGEQIAGSVLVEHAGDLEAAYETGAFVVICQGDPDNPHDLVRMLGVAAQFLNKSRAKRPQLLCVDELLDFYHPNGAPRGGSSALIRAVRTFRERGTGVLYASQRTRGIPAQIMEEMSKAWIFRLDYEADAKRLVEMGAPAAIVEAIPADDWDFIYWTKLARSRLWGPYRLDV